METLDDLLRDLNDLPSAPKYNHVLPSSRAAEGAAGLGAGCLPGANVSRQPGATSKAPQRSPGHQAHAASSQPPAPHINSSAPNLQPVSSTVPGARTSLASHAPKRGGRSSAAGTPISGHTGSAIDALEDLLSDLDVPSASTSIPAVPATRQSQSNSQIAPKCMGGVYLGNTTSNHGRNGAVIGKLHCCDNLRCTKCDFKVIVFSSCCWDADCDYLFFRNNYPTQSKLAVKYSSQAGACAYCCQCSWRTLAAGQETRVDAYASDLRWVCGGHQL